MMIMDIVQIKSLIAKGEKINVEFKKSQKEVPKSVYESVCAFNNRVGGHILLGVTDDKEIVGIEEKYADKIIQDFLTAINNPELIYPTLYVIPEKVEIDGKILLYIFVPEGREVCQYKKAFWDRSYEGDINITKNQDLVYKLFARKRGESFVDRSYPALGMDFLDPMLIQKARKKAVARNKEHPWAEMSDEELLQTAGLMVVEPNSGKYGITIACVLLFGKDNTIMSVLPQYKTDAIFRVENLDRYDDRDVVITNLLDSYERLMEFGKKHLNDLFVLDGIQSISARDRILREIISNILCHRDYSSKYPAKFVIEKGQMYTENSNLSHGIGNLDIKTFSPFPKNPTISKIFREIGLADELGSGMRNTNKYTVLYSEEEPIFSEGDIFRTIIPLKNIATIRVGGDKPSIKTVDKPPIKNTQTQLEEILRYAAFQEEFRRVEIEEILDIKSSRAKELIRVLVKNGSLESIGGNKDRRYKLKK